MKKVVQQPKKWTSSRLHVQHNRSGLCKLEVIALLCILLLLLQVLAFPSLLAAAVVALDFRQWPRHVWLWLNCGVVTVLISVRVAPGLYEEWRDRRIQQMSDRDKQHRLMEIKDRRERLQGYSKSRSRRFY